MTSLSADVDRSTLENSLTVLTREVHTAPVTSFWIWYRVGSRNEQPGLTGLSHWVEHMLFKGTPTYPQGEFDRMIQREGGRFNGMTWLDWTTYFETLPSDRIDLALQIESDRMVNSLFDSEEVDRERTVIISEREGHENHPTYLLYEQLRALSLQAHPYGHPVIGTKEDLRRISRDDLLAHYQSHYHPGNATIVVVGDFQTGEMLQHIQGYFGSIPEMRHNLTPVPVEPPGRGERRIEMEGPGSATYIGIAHTAPAATHDDFFAMVVLDAILGGARGLPPFGGAPMGRSARLYRALVNTGLAVSASSSVAATIDPYLFTLSAIVHPEQDKNVVELALLDEVKRLHDELVSDEELRKAIKGARVQFIYGSETVTNQAMWLGLAEIAASTDWLANFLERLSCVSADDVQRVAQTYLTPRNRVIGSYLPLGDRS